MSLVFASTWLPFLAAGAAVAGVILHWYVEALRHRALIAKLPIRIHVNGIRGKSTIVRYIAAALREGGIETVAKTSGSATRFIDADGEEQDVERAGAPTIIEQIKVLRRHVQPTTEAIVFECMAVRPDYQHTSEHRIIRSTLGVICNVRRDHLEELGYDLTSIARSLSSTMPPGRPVITAETGETQLNALREEAAQRKTELIEVDPESITNKEMKPLGPFAFRENVAIALAIADRLGIDRQTALNGVGRAKDDPGASEAYEVEIDGASFHWVNLFGINDPESVQENIEQYLDWLDRDRPGIVLLLNNRDDREDRAADFADWIGDLNRIDGVVVTGSLTGPVAERLRRNGVDAEMIHVTAGETDAEIDEILTWVRGRSGDADLTALIGLANIHTQAADLIRARLEDRSDAEKIGTAEAEDATD